jgi:hypothetical protein
MGHVRRDVIDRPERESSFHADRWLAASGAPPTRRVDTYARYQTGGRRPLPSTSQSLAKDSIARQAGAAGDLIPHIVGPIRHSRARLT